MPLIKRIFAKFSLKKRIFAILSLAFTCVIILILGIYLNFSTVEMINQATKNEIKNLDIIAQKLDIIIDNAENTAVFSLANNDVQKWFIKANELSKDNEKYFLVMQDSVVNIFSNLIQTNLITNIVLKPLNNSNIYPMFNYEDPEESVFLDEFFANDARNKWRVSPLINAGNDSMFLYKSKCFFTYYHKIYDKWTVNLLGAVSVMINESRISKLYNDIDKSNNARFYILDENNSIISAKDKNVLLNNGKYLISKNNGEVKIDGVDCISVSEKYEKMNWTIVGTIPIKEITQLNQKLQMSTIYIAIVLLIATLFISNFIATLLSYPIVKLQGLMLEAGNGYRKLDFDIDRNDEIGDLNKEFKRMLSNTDMLNKQIVDENNNQKELELTLLQSQINPHFLYNSLECICGLSSLKENEQVIKMTNELAVFYRHVFHGRSKFATVENEIGMLTRYLNIIQYRYPNKLKYSISCDFDGDKYNVVKLSTQPIVENAIVHGLRNSRKKWEVCIHAFIVDDTIHICVRDNGVGMSEQKVYEILHDKNYTSRKHFGIMASDERIKILCGKEFGIRIISGLGNGTQVDVSYPCRSKAEEEAKDV